MRRGKRISIAPSGQSCRQEPQCQHSSGYFTNDLFSSDGRCQIHVQIVAEVRRRMGHNGAIFIRLGACDEMTGGLTLDEGCATAARLAEAGVDLISVSGGLQGSELTGRAPGYFVPYAAAIKSFVTVPIMVTGGITDAAMADRIIRYGQADLIGIGRAMLNDAQWARKASRRPHRDRPSGLITRTGP